MLNLENPFWIYVGISLLGLYCGIITTLYIKLMSKSTKLSDALAVARNGLKDILSIKDNVPPPVYCDVISSRWYEYYKLLNKYTVKVVYENILTKDWYAECFVYYDGSTIFAEVIMSLDDLVSMSVDTTLLERHVLTELCKRYDVDAVRYKTFDYVGDRSELMARSKDFHTELNKAFVGTSSDDVYLFHASVRQA